MGGQKWLEEEKIKAKEMLLSGRTCREVAQNLGKTSGGVSNYNRRYFN